MAVGLARRLPCSRLPVAMPVALPVRCKSMASSAHATQTSPGDVLAQCTGRLVRMLTC